MSGVRGPSAMMRSIACRMPSCAAVTGIAVARSPASSRRSRSWRSGWRCSCRKCPAPSRAPVRTATGSCAPGSGWPTAQCRWCRCRPGRDPTKYRRTGWRRPPRRSVRGSARSARTEYRCAVCPGDIGVLARHLCHALIPVRHADGHAVGLGGGGQAFARALLRQLEGVFQDAVHARRVKTDSGSPSRVRCLRTSARRARYSPSVFSRTT